MCGPWMSRLEASDVQSRPCMCLSRQSLQLAPAVLQPHRVRAVDHPDQALRGLEIVPPVRAYGLLSAYVPDIELVAFILHRVDLETQRRAYRRDVLTCRPIKQIHNRCMAITRWQLPVIGGPAERLLADYC